MNVVYRNKDRPDAISPISFDSAKHAYEGTVWRTNEGYDILININIKENLS